MDLLFRTVHVQTFFNPLIRSKRVFNGVHGWKVLLNESLLLYNKWFWASVFRKYQSKYSLHISNKCCYCLSCNLKHFIRHTSFPYNYFPGFSRRYHLVRKRFENRRFFLSWTKFSVHLKKTYVLLLPFLNTIQQPSREANQMLWILHFKQ